MTFNSPTNEFQELNERFYNWKINNPNKHFPKEYWNEALNLLSKYSVDEVAQLTGFPPSYITRKQQQRRSSASSDTSKIEFSEIQPRHTPCFHPVHLNIQDSHGVEVKLDFHGDVALIFSLIFSLFKKEY